MKWFNVKLSYSPIERCGILIKIFGELTESGIEIIVDHQLSVPQDMIL